MTRPVRLDLDQEHLALAAGGTARVQLTLRNTSDVVQHLHVEVRGLPPGAQARTEPATVKLLPAATAECALVLELPTAPAADAGAYVLGVLARSPHRREVSRCEEVRLDVPAAPGLALSVEPELVRAGARAAFTATLRNTGNATVRVAMSGSDPERQVALRFSPAEVVLDPRQTAPVAVSARAPRAWTGQDHRRPLTLVATADELTATQTVSYVQPPRLPPFAIRLLVGVATVLVMASAAAFAGVLPGTGAGDTDAAGVAGESPTPSVGGSPAGSVPATPTATVPPTPPSPAPTASAPTADPGPSTAEPSPTIPDEPDGLAPSSRSVDLVPPGAVTTVDFVDADTWLADGIRVTAVPEAAGAECRTADRLVAHPGAPRGFVTAATPEDPGACNDVPLRVTFVGRAAPATGVILDVAQAGDYLLTGAAREGQRLQTSEDVDSGLLAKALSGATLGSVTLAADPEGDATPTAVGLSRVTLAPAADGDGS